MNNTMNKIIIRTIIFVISTGWLVPVKLSFTLFSEWTYHAVYTNNHEMNSFPYFTASQESGLFGFIWLSIVVIGWAIYLIFYLPTKRKDGENTR